MPATVSLSSPELDWEVLVRLVERTGTPLWLELDGTLHGVLSPAVNVQRRLGRYLQATQPPVTAGGDGGVVLGSDDV